MLDKPVFISGVSGGIGKSLALALLARGVSIRGISRNPEATTAFFENNPRADIRYGDITKPETLEGQLKDCALVYHSAGYLSGNKSLFHPINVVGTENMLQAAERARVERFVHISSITIYGPYDQFQGNVTEAAPFEHPAAYPYSQTKREADLLAQSYMGRVPVVVARPGEVYGPHQTVWTVLMAQLAKNMLLHPPAKAQTGWLNLIYGENLADALILLGEHPEAIGEVYNIVDGEPTTTHDYFKYLIRLVKRPVLPMPRFVLKSAVSIIATSANLLQRESMITTDSFHYFFAQMTISNKKLKNELEWNPPFSREQALARTKEWLQSQHLL